jgi:hypothetical protein
VVREDIAPLVEGFVAGQDNAAALALVAAGNQLEQELSGTLVEGETAHFVEDEDVWTTQGLHALGQAVGPGIVGELVEQIGDGVEQHGLPRLTARWVLPRLADRGTGRFSIGDEAQADQVTDLTFVDKGTP